MNEDDELEGSGFFLEAVQQVAAGETQSCVMIPTFGRKLKTTLRLAAGHSPTKSQSKVIKFRTELLFSDLYFNP